MKKSMLWMMLCTGFMCAAHSQANDDLVGIWQNIDDKTGSPKALDEISKTPEGTYVGKVVKITPRPDYKPQDKCTKCPGKYKNQPILGLEVFNGLKKVNDNAYAEGEILDPLSGNIYKLKGKLTGNKKRLHLRGYVGVSAIGRTQTWIRQE